MSKRQIAGDHYDSPIEHVKVVVANGFNYLEAQALKYIWRHRRKNGEEDIKKSIHYLLFILKYEYRAISKKKISKILQILEED